MGDLWRSRKEHGLADECAAFLIGTLADCLEDHGRAVPVWVWMNLLAHGSRDLIAESISRPSRRRLLTRCWWIARARLADLILEMTDRFPLSDLQESVLIPLELNLAARTDVPFWTAHQWVETVITELHRHDHTSQNS